MFQHIPQQLLNGLVGDGQELFIENLEFTIIRDRHVQSVPLHFLRDPDHGIHQIIRITEQPRAKIGHERSCVRQRLVQKVSDFTHRVV